MGQVRSNREKKPRIAFGKKPKHGGSSPRYLSVMVLLVPQTGISVSVHKCVQPFAPAGIATWRLRWKLQGRRQAWKSDGRTGPVRWLAGPDQPILCPVDLVSQVEGSFKRFTPVAVVHLPDVRNKQSMLFHHGMQGGRGRRKLFLHSMSVFVHPGCLRSKAREH